jgi:hypothetical protein
MLLANAALSALVNLLVFAGLPFFSYFAYQKWRHQRTFGEILRRAGLQLGAGQYVVYSVCSRSLASRFSPFGRQRWTRSSAMDRPNSRLLASG